MKRRHQSQHPDFQELLNSSLEPVNPPKDASRSGFESAVNARCETDRVDGFLDSFLPSSSLPVPPGDEYAYLQLPQESPAACSTDAEQKPLLSNHSADDMGFRAKLEMSIKAEVEARFSEEAKILRNEFLCTVKREIDADICFLRNEIAHVSHRVATLDWHGKVRNADGSTQSLDSSHHANVMPFDKDPSALLPDLPQGATESLRAYVEVPKMQLAVAITILQEEVWALREEVLMLRAASKPAPSELEVNSNDIQDAGSLLQCRLPESLYSFCLAQLAVHPQRWVRPVVLLLFSLTIQTYLICSCTVSLFIEMITAHWSIHEHSRVHCIYQAKMLFGIPATDVITSMAIMLLATFYIISDDKESMTTIYPDEHAPFFARMISNIAWFQFSFMLPTFLIGSLSTLMAGATGGSGIVMNGLAVTFLTQVDNTLYDAILSSHDKQWYMALRIPVSAKPKHALTKYSWGLFAATYSAMVGSYMLMVSTGEKCKGKEYVLALFSDPDPACNDLCLPFTVWLSLGLFVRFVLHNASVKQESEMPFQFNPRMRCFLTLLILVGQTLFQFFVFVILHHFIDAFFGLDVDSPEGITKCETD